jgi:hypothetical protein
MDEDLPQPVERRILLPGAPDPGHGIGAYPLLLHVIAVAARNFPTLASIQLPTAVISSTVMFLGAPTIADPPLEPGRTYEIPPNEWLVMAGLVLFLLSFGAWSSAALMRSAHGALTEGRALPFTKAFGAAVERVPSYLATQFLYGLMAGLGACACLLPGLWAATAFAPGLARAALRPVGPIQALREGKALTSGRFWNVAGFLGLSAIVTYALAIPLFTVSFVLPHGDPGSRYVKMIINIVFGVVLAVVQLTGYAALHERLEETT